MRLSLRDVAALGRNWTVDAERKKLAVHTVKFLTLVYDYEHLQAAW